MKFQHLILPLLLWGIVITGVIRIPPSNPLIVGGGITLVTSAVFFTFRIFSHGKITIISAGYVFLLLLANALMGFSFINLLLIAAISILISLL